MPQVIYKVFRAIGRSSGLVLPLVRHNEAVHHVLGYPMSPSPFHRFCSVWGDHLRHQHGRGFWRRTRYNQYATSYIFIKPVKLTLRASVNTSNGDITSLLYNSVQLQDSSKFTHLSSGLGWYPGIFLAF